MTSAKEGDLLGEKIFFGLVSLFLWPLGFCAFLWVGLVYLLLISVMTPQKVQWLARFLCRIVLLASGQWLVVRGDFPPVRTGPYIIVFNHESLFDAFMLYAVLPFPVSGVGAKEQFSRPIWSAILRRHGVISIDRGEVRSAIESMNAAEQLLKNGHSMIIAPEGTRTLDGELGAFKKGAFHVALHTGVPILPLGFVGGYRAKSKKDWRIRPGKLVVNVGKPIEVSEYKELSVEKLRDLVRENIRGLSSDGG